MTAAAADNREVEDTLRKLGDEAAWAAFRQAEQLCRLGRYDAALAAAARGLGASATSAECAWIASAAALQLDRDDQAVAWARIAEAVGRYRGCGDKDHTHPARYELPYDVLRFALPDKRGRAQANRDFRAARRARFGVKTDWELDRLGVLRSTPHPIRNEARIALRPGPIRSLCLSARFTPIDFTPPKGWRPTNPGLCRHAGAIWCVVRTVNYLLHDKGYSVDDPKGVVRTENYLGRFARDGHFVDVRPMRDLDPSPRHPEGIVGYEDVRLVSIGRKLVGSATVCDRDSGQRRKIVRLDLDARGNVASAKVQPSEQQHEKNWMPLALNGRIAWIYSIDPTVILPGIRRDCPLALDHLRGGAAIDFDGGYLCVTHETVETNRGRIYLHRFVKMNRKFAVTRVSPAWVFAHHGIEFCAGIVQDGNRLILSFGIEDREAWIMRMDVKDVEEIEWIEP